MAKDNDDKVIEEPFPRQCPPASSGITGPRADKPRPASQRDDDSRPKGTPNRDRQATETAHTRKSRAARFPARPPAGCRPGRHARTAAARALAASHGPLRELTVFGASFGGPLLYGHAVDQHAPSLGLAQIGASFAH